LGTTLVPEYFSVIATNVFLPVSTDSALPTACLDGLNIRSLSTENRKEKAKKKKNSTRDNENNGTPVHVV
jgi:hypothetical protein